MCFSTVLCMSSVVTCSCTLINCIMRIQGSWDVTLRHYVSHVRHFKCPFFMDHWTFEVEGRAFVQNVWCHLASDATSHPRRLEFSVTLLWKPQISHNSVWFGEWSDTYPVYDLRLFLWQRLVIWSYGLWRGSDVKKWMFFNNAVTCLDYILLVVDEWISMEHW
jgi:hypothetical protein